MGEIIKNIRGRESWDELVKKKKKPTNSTPLTFKVGVQNIELVKLTNSTQLILGRQTPPMYVIRSQPQHVALICI